MNEPGIRTGPHAASHLGRLLSLLRRIRDEKLYRPLARSWRAFCSPHLADLTADQTADLTADPRTIVLELVDLLDACPSHPDPSLLLDAATELRMYLIHLALEARGALPD